MTLSLTATIGIIGAMTGIAGLVVSVFNYRRISRLKMFDLRLELRQEEADLLREWQTLPDLISKANGSRVNVRAAQGRGRGREMEAWKAHVTADHEAVRALEAKFHTSAAKNKLNDHQMADRLVEVHDLRATVRAYADKYRSELTADDRDRTLLAENIAQEITRLP